MKLRHILRIWLAETILGKDRLILVLRVPDQGQPPAALKATRERVARETGYDVLLVKGGGTEVEFDFVPRKKQ